MKTLLLMAGVLTVASVAAEPRQASPAPVPSQAPAFEVASIKRNKSGDGFISISLSPQRPTFTNVPARQLIVRAYNVQPFQVVGGPSWITTDRFDITAKAPDAATPQQMNDMLQSLLADRFKLKVHRETRQGDVYRLVKARPDGKLGDAIKPAAIDCSAMMGRGRPGGPGPAPGGPGSAAVGTSAVPAPSGRPAGPAPAPAGPMSGCQMMMTPGRVQMGGQPISALANTLSNQLGRPIVDDTGLTGPYDLTLSFMPDPGGRGMPIGPLPPGAPELPPIDPNAPSLPTALQEQLGLKLESGKGPVDVIVIDSIEPPTED